AAGFNINLSSTLQQRGHQRHLAYVFQIIQHSPPELCGEFIFQ
ncbi:hypothetical protein X975_01560, partial [Stegodyphus mimosarum]